MELKFKKLNPNAILPTRGTPDSAGLDMYAILPDVSTEMTILGGSPMTTAVHQNYKDETAFDQTRCISIPPNRTILIPTGLAVEPSRKDVALLIYPRSGLAVKQNIILANCVAVIDSDYRGEIKIPLYNNSNKPVAIYDGDRIAQMVVTPILFPAVSETDTLTETIRADGGFGSTGV